MYSDCSISDTEGEQAVGLNTQEWEGEPMRRARSRTQNRQVEITDELFEDPVRQYVPPDTKEWCVCQKCQAWEVPEMNVCCQHHQIWHNANPEEQLSCITESTDIQDLLRPAPLRMMYYNYRAYHNPVLPDAESLVESPACTKEYIEKRKREQMRFSAYRSIVFWSFPTIGRKERRPLPSCIYGIIRAMYPPTDDEEEYADYQFSTYIPEAADE